MTAQETRSRLQPEGLLRRSRRRIPALEAVAGLARSVLTAALTRMSSDSLVVEELGRPRARYGPGGGLEATVTISDRRAWSAVLTEGSIGLGRGYIEGWWTSDDPVTVVRVIVRNLAWLDEARNAVDRRTRWFTDPVRRMAPRAGRRRNREDIATHYDLGNEFFSVFLDETMSYSSAIFPTPDAGLGAASLHKYDRIIDELAVRRDHHVLEIGTGWGGFVLRAIETTGCRVTTTTISRNQLEEARRRVELAGVADRARLLDVDWRDLTGRYDRVVSIEMIEAVDWRDYGRFFAKIEASLEPDGMAAIQAICIPDRRFHRAKHTEDFIRRFVFPGGYLPSLGAISDAVAGATKLQVVAVDDYGEHYAETLRRWRRRFDARSDEVRALGLDDRFCRLWRFYLAYCEAAFRERHTTVCQIVIAGREWRRPIR